MSTIAITNQKGGSAKTTTTIHLGVALAARGRRVLLVDMDPQGHLAEGLGFPALDLAHDISEVLDHAQPLTPILLTVRPGVELAPSTIRLSYIEAGLYTKLRREDRLKVALAPVSGAYDDVLIDCPPSLGILTINALSAADEVLIPMAADFYSMLGVGLLLRTIEEMRAEINPTLGIRGLLPTRYARTTNAREVLDHTRAELAEQVHIFPCPIPETVKFREAAGLGKTIFEHAPETPAAAAYRALAEEMAGD